MTAKMKGQKYWDGNQALDFKQDDGGRAAAGFKGNAGDCVARAVAIASGKPYGEVYAALAKGMGDQRKSEGKTARNGVSTRRKWFKEYMHGLGFTWTATMQIGQGCKTHLLAGELPPGRLVVAVSKHYTAVIDGCIRDTFDPTRTVHISEHGIRRMTHRCVYGYWTMIENSA